MIDDDIKRGEAAETVYKIEPSHSHLLQSRESNSGRIQYVTRALGARGRMVQAHRPQPFAGPLRTGPASLVWRTVVCSPSLIPPLWIIPKIGRSPAPLG